MTILFSHGNAEDLGYIVQYFKHILPDLNANIFAYDYTGYGSSSGTPSEADVYADIEASFLYLRDTAKVPWSSIVLFGRSLGTSASTHLASLTPVRGIILQCPMLSVFRIAFNSRFTFPGDQLVSIDRMDMIESPMLVIHGMCDEIVPFWHGLEVWKNLKNKSVGSQIIEPFWVPNAMHNDIEIMALSEFSERISHFLTLLETSPISTQLENQKILI